MYKRVKSWVSCILAVMLFGTALIVVIWGGYRSRQGDGAGMFFARCRNCNILFISIDALGARHLPCYGYTRDTTPHLCRLASHGTLFTNAYTNASWTLPSHVSLFTGQYPSTHNVRDFGDILAGDKPFLPDILHRHGYETLFYIPSRDPTLPTEDVYKRGIDHVDSQGYTPSTTGYEDMTRYLTDALRTFAEKAQSGQRTFAFLHTYYVHSPYVIEERPALYTRDRIANIPIAERFIYRQPFDEGFYRYLMDYLVKGDDGWLPEEATDDVVAALRSAPSLREAERIFRTAFREYAGFFYNAYYYNATIGRWNPRHIAYVRDLYDQKIHELDQWVGETLVPFIEDPVIKQRTVVVITSDHGEEFMEHGGLFHETVYDAVMNVPLIVLTPSRMQAVVTKPVQSADVAPTLLDMLGISPREYAFDGVSLLPVMRGRRMVDRVLIAEGHTRQNPVYTVRDANWKLFLIGRDGKYLPYQLFDIGRDPVETEDVIFRNSAVVERLKRAFLEYRTRSDLRGSL